MAFGVLRGPNIRAHRPPHVSAKGDLDRRTAGVVSHATVRASFEGGVGDIIAVKCFLGRTAEMAAKLREWWGDVCDMPVRTLF